MASDTSLIFDILARDRATAEFAKVRGSALTAGAAINKAFDGKNLGSGLEKKLSEAKIKVRELSEEFEKTGDVKILEKIKIERGKVNSIRGMLRDLKKDTEAIGNAAKTAGEQAEQGFKFFEGGLMETLKSPGGIAAAGLLGATLAIPLGAAVGGLATAGIGIGAAGAGVAGALSGPDAEKITKSYDKVFGDVKQRWITGSEAFTEPLIKASHTFDEAFQHIDIEGILKKASTFIGPLSEGAARFATYLGEGIGTVVDKAGPVIRVVSDELPALGSAIRSALTDIADSSEGGAEALHDFLVMIEAIIVGTGKFIGFAEDAYSAIKDFGNGFRDAVTYLRDTNGLLWATLAPTAALLDLFNPDKPRAFAQSLDGAAHGVQDLGDNSDASQEKIDGLMSKISATTHTVDDLAAAMVDKLIGAMMSLDQAELGFEESLTRLSDATKENGRQLDIHTKKGQNNREAILAAVSANAQLYQENIKSGMSAEQAAAAYDANTASLERQLRKAGLTQAQIDGLIGKYAKVPDDVNTDITAHGLTEAINNLNALIKKIFNIPDGHFNIYGAYIGPHIGSIGGKEGPGKYASGTLSAPGGMALVGELGPELVDLPTGARVYTAAETSRMLQASPGSGSGNGGPTQIIFGSDGSVIGDAILHLVRNSVRLQGGDAAVLGIR